MIPKTKRLSVFLLLLFGSILLLTAALWNGFPLLYADSSTYIASGFTVDTPVDRPMMYGLFIRLTSFNGISIWVTIFIQCFMVSYLVFITIRDFTRFDTNKTYLAVMLVISFLTALPFVTGQILADVFMPICFLSIVHILYNDKLSRTSLIGLFFLFFLSNTMHMSHVAINAIVVISSIVLYWFWPERYKMKWKNGIVLILLTLIAIPFMGSALAKSKHVFFTGKMAGSGILQEYLAEHCPEKDYKICDCIDSIPSNTTDFLWNESSPLYTRYESWYDAKSDFSDIIWGSFKSPHYIGRHIKESLISTSVQLITFDAGEGNGSFGKESLLFQRIKNYFPNDYDTYLSSIQYAGRLMPKYLESRNIIFRISVIIGLVLIFVILIIHQLYPPLKKLSILLLIAVFVNSFVNSSLVIVADRFGAKMIWLIPFIATLFLIDYILSKQQHLKFNT